MDKRIQEMVDYFDTGYFYVYCRIVTSLPPDELDFSLEIVEEIDYEGDETIFETESYSSREKCIAAGYKMYLKRKEKETADNYYVNDVLVKKGNNG